MPLMANKDLSNISTECKENIPISQLDLSGAMPKMTSSQCKHNKSGQEMMHGLFQI
jgi:hypothetical protein